MLESSNVQIKIMQIIINRPSEYEPSPQSRRGTCAEMSDKGHCGLCRAGLGIGTVTHSLRRDDSHTMHSFSRN